MSSLIPLKVKSSISVINTKGGLLSLHDSFESTPLEDSILLIENKLYIKNSKSVDIF